MLMASQCIDEALRLPDFAVNWFFEYNMDGCTPYCSYHKAAVGDLCYLSYGHTLSRWIKSFSRLDFQRYSLDFGNWWWSQLLMDCKHLIVWEGLSQHIAKRCNAKGEALDANAANNLGDIIEGHVALCYHVWTRGAALADGHFLEIRPPKAIEHLAAAWHYFNVAGILPNTTLAGFLELVLVDDCDAPNPTQVKDSLDKFGPRIGDPTQLYDRDRISKAMHILGSYVLQPPPLGEVVSYHPSTPEVFCFRLHSER